MLYDSNLDGSGHLAHRSPVPPDSLTRDSTEEFGRPVTQRQGVAFYGIRDGLRQVFVIRREGHRQVTTDALQHHQPR
jgi:hypothetical protein